MMSHFLLYSSKLYTRGGRRHTSLTVSISRCFLFKNGDSTSTNLCLLQTPFSTKPPISNNANKSFTVSYLVNSCGLPEDEALSASKKVQLKTSAKPDSVLALFRKHGFSDTQISRIIKKFTSLLSTKPDKTLTPKLEYFSSIGFSGPDLAKLVCRCPYILNYSLERRIKPNVAFFKGLGITQSNVNRLITCSSWVLRQNPQILLAPNIAVLKNHRVPDCYISRLIVLNARAFEYTDKFAKTVEEVVKLKLEPSKGSFVEAVHVLSGLNKSSWEYKCNTFKHWGWSEDDIHMAFGIKPNFMTFSEKKVTSVMEFLVNKIGYDPSKVSKDPFILTYSLEKRIIPRLSVIHILIANGFLDKNFNISGVLRLTDLCFLRRFVTKFKGEVPTLLNVFQGK